MSARAAWRLETLGYTEVYRYVAGKVDWLANGLPGEGQFATEPRIGELAIRDVPTCTLDEHVGDVRRRLAAADDDLCVVVNTEGVVLGDVRGTAVTRAGDDALVEDVMRPGPSTYRPNVTLAGMAEHLGETGAARMLITDADGHLIGLLRREDVDQAFHAAHAGHGGGPFLATR